MPSSVGRTPGRFVRSLQRQEQRARLDRLLTEPRPGSALGPPAAIADERESSVGGAGRGQAPVKDRQTHAQRLGVVHGLAGSDQCPGDERGFIGQDGLGPRPRRTLDGPHHAISACRCCRRSDRRAVRRRLRGFDARQQHGGARTQVIERGNVPRPWVKRSAADCRCWSMPPPRAVRAARASSARPWASSEPSIQPGTVRRADVPEPASRGDERIAQEVQARLNTRLDGRPPSRAPCRHRPR